MGKSFSPVLLQMHVCYTREQVSGSGGSPEAATPLVRIQFVFPLSLTSLRAPNPRQLSAQGFGLCSSQQQQGSRSVITKGKHEAETIFPGEPGMAFLAHSCLTLSNTGG